jgi:hypothetical protein
MQSNLIIISLVGLLALSGQSYGQAKASVVDFLSIPGPLPIQKQMYLLTWSAHPDASLYKHEYLTAGDAFPNYMSLVTIDFVVTASAVDQAVATKVRELEQLKKSGYDVNYEIISHAATGEKIIDCLIGQTAADDRNSLVERDVYRFKGAKAKSGQQGIVLFAVSVRKYGKDIKPFLIKLKADRPVLLNEVAKLQMPEINLTKSY